MQGRVCSLIRMQRPVLANRGLLFSSGATVPTDGADGYQTGCIFQHTDGGAETALYVNEGSVSSCAFKALKALESAELADLSDVGALAYTSGWMLVADGDSYEETDDIALPYTGSFKLGTFASLLHGSGVAISSSKTWAAAIYSDDNNANIGSSVRGILSRFLLTTDQSGGSIRALMGQLKLADGVDVATGIYTGVQGYVELAGDHSAQSGATFSCFDASLEIASGKALTVDSGGEACGVHVETTGAGTITNNGTCAAILIDKASGAANWPYGVYVVGSTCHQAFVAGVQGTGVETTTTYPFAVEIHNEANADIVAGATGSSAGIYNRYAIIVAQTSQCNHISMFGKLRVKANMADGNHVAMYGYIEQSGTVTVSGTSSTLTAAGLFAIETASTFTLSTGHLNGICIDSSVHASATISGTMAGLRIKKSSGCLTWPTGIALEASACTTGISIGVCTTGLAITGATGYAIDIATSGVFRMGVQDTGVDLTTSYPFAMDVQCEANADITAGATGSSAGIYARYAIEAAQTSQCNHIAMFAKLRPKANLADGNHAAGYFYIEQSGTVTISGTSTTTTAAVVAAVETGSALNLSTGHLNGVYINSSVHANSTISGTMAALRIGKSTSAKAWPTGITLESGACDKLISGTCTMSGSSALNSIEITTTSVTTHSSGYERSIYVNHTHETGAATGSSEVNAIAADLQCTSNITQAYCFTAYTGSMAGATVNRVAHYAGYLDAITGTVNASSVAFFETVGGATYNSFIAVRRHGGTIHAIISDMSGGATANNFFEFSGANLPVASGDATGGAKTYKLACKVGGATKYIQLYDA